MSNELESDRANTSMATNLESFGVDGAGYDETDSDTEPPSSTNPQCRSCFRSLRLYVRFLLERGLRSSFRNLGFCGHDLPTNSPLNDAGRCQYRPPGGGPPRPGCFPLAAAFKFMMVGTSALVQTSGHRARRPRSRTTRRGDSDAPRFVDFIASANSAANW